MSTILEKDPFLNKTAILQIVKLTFLNKYFLTLKFTNHEK